MSGLKEEPQMKRLCYGQVLLVVSFWLLVIGFWSVTEKKERLKSKLLSIHFVSYFFYSEKLL